MLARCLRYAALLTLLLCLSESSQAQDKAKPADKTSETVDADTLEAGEYFGKLLNTPGSDGQFTLRIDQSRYEAKDSAAAARVTNQLNSDLQRARQLEQVVALNATPQQLNELQRVYNQIRQGQSRQRELYKVTPNSKDIDFHSSADMVVRFLLPPTVYDEKGERKKFSLIDLREMRGVDPNVPGFEAKVTDLQPGQILRVSLHAARPAAKKPTTEDAGKAKAKPAPKMEATMAVIVVAEDTTPINQNNKDTGKKKKKAK